MASSRIPPIQCLLSFEALARLRSVTAAADELSVTPSAVSHRIRQLESRVGCSLFARADFSLTEEGHAYLAKVRPAIKALEPPTTVHPRSGPVRLRVSVPPTFSRQILLPRLPLFRHAFPDVELTLLVSIPLINVSVEPADIDIRFGKSDEPGLQKLLLMADEIFPVCSPEYFHENGPFDGFDSEQTIARASLIRNPLEPWRTWFDLCGLALPEPLEGAQFNDIGLSLDAAVAGYGVALARGKLAVQWLDSGRLIRVSPRTVASPHQHYLCWKSGTLDRWECSAFVDWLKAAVP
jgi:LysR family transcriptional regulator, glycine cleavage system transcriptional activator